MWRPLWYTRIFRLINIKNTLESSIVTLILNWIIYSKASGILVLSRPFTFGLALVLFFFSADYRLKLPLNLQKIKVRNSPKIPVKKMNYKFIK